MSSKGLLFNARSIQVRNAAETLKKVLHKHNHQREKREFVTPKPAQDVAKASQESALLQRQKKAKAKKTEKSLDSSPDSGFPKRCLRFISSFFWLPGRQVGFAAVSDLRTQL